MKKCKAARLQKFCTYFLFFQLSLLIGCSAGSLHSLLKKDTPRKHPYHLIIEKYYAKARKEEKKGDLHSALTYFTLVDSFQSKNHNVKQDIYRIRRIITIKTDHHFKLGLSYVQSGLTDLGKNEFIKVLTYNPDHRYALFYLNQIIPDDLFAYYLVKKEETLKSIAQSIYNDPKKYILLSYFNEIEPNQKLVSGTVIQYPIIKADIKKTKKKEEPIIAMQKNTPPVENQIVKEEKELMVQKAKSYLDSQNYKEARKISLSLLDNYKGDDTIKEILYSSIYFLGKEHISQNKFFESLSFFTALPLNYKDTKNMVAFLEKKLNHDADTHYLQGVNYFLKENLQRAIREWEMTLELNPHHEKAEKDINKAYNLLRKLNELD